MSSETCPFCGKSFKRLKSHLPYCKAPKHLKTSTTQDEVVVSEKTSPPLAQSTKLTSALSEKIITKSTQSTPTSSAKSSPQTKKSKRTSLLSSTTQSASKPTPLMSATISSSLQSPPLSPSSSSSSAATSLPTSPKKKKKKQKLVDEIKMATMFSSPKSLSPSPPPNFPPSKPKKKNLRTLTEAAMSSQVPEVSREGTKSAPVDLDSLSIPFSPVTDPLISRTSALTGNLSNPYKDSGNTQLPLPSADIQLKKGASNDGRPNKRVNFRVDAEGTGTDLSERGKLFGPDQARVILQDVKATLGRSNTSPKSSLLDQLKTTTSVLTTDILPSKTETSGPETVGLNPCSHPMPNQNNISPLLTPVAQSNHSSSTSCQSPVKKERHTEANKSEQVFFTPHKDEGSAQPKPTSLPSPQSVSRCDPPTSLVTLAASLSSPVSMTEGVNMGCHKMGLISASLSIPQTLEPPSPSPSACVTHPMSASKRLTMETPQPKFNQQNVTVYATGGALTQRRLGQVTLRELPEWLAIKTPSHPKEIVEMLQRGWQWYYRRYIDVKKGGVGGVGMLLVGYCALSYVWSYPHIKRDRWRKYH
ncbi:uncharacterized protein si:dkey-21c1.4 [Lampris incognitus]|uniref:uncharacterized protein si:dkey-21c1.4 n=1 Tax=Lampris incognitus TaxID=2546036 RepID=UPI0024B61003|nr:uncharacterized protein si:dkey-21c1.4 [Lampris incognitus]